VEAAASFHFNSHEEIDMTKIVTPTTLEEDPAWEALRARGFDTGYVRMHGTNPRIISPIITVEEALERGFFPKGTQVRLGHKAGYDYQWIAALKAFNMGTYTVKKCTIDRSSSDYEFEEISGRWNSVMFEKVEDDVS
jgi:hypothetical protein